MNTTIPDAYEPADRASAGLGPASSMSFCPQCLQRVHFQPTGGERVWVHCSKKWYASSSVRCPNPDCARCFDFNGRRQCPFCRTGLDDGVPLAPRLQGNGLLDLILPRRGPTFRAQLRRAEREFGTLYESWRADSNSISESIGEDETRFSRDFNELLGRHKDLLNLFKGDVDKFLYAAPIRLARVEGEYSWKLEEALAKEVNSVLEGILYKRHWVPNSLGFVARCLGQPPYPYSRGFLAAELRRQFYERRSVPRPGFQLTLEYARTLDGLSFEDWLVRLLRDAGVAGVCKTQASRDQGADIVITTGTRKIIIQAKNYEDTTGNKSVQEALAALHYYSASEAWVVSTSNFSADAIDLAQRTGVHLVDGTRLLNLPDLVSRGSQTTASPPAPSDSAQPLQTSESPALSLGASALGPGRANLGHSTKPEVGSDAWHSPAAIAALPRFWGSRLSLRNRRLIGLGLGVAALFLAFAAYRSHVSQQEIRNERSTQELAKQGVMSLLQNYLAAERALNPQLLADCYAPEVWTFYRRQGVSRSDVLREFQRDFAGFQTVQMVQFSQITFNDLGESQATATFNKAWDVRGARNFAGSETEQMIFKKIDGKWLIVSEKELKIWWVRRTSA